MKVKFFILAAALLAMQLLFALFIVMKGLTEEPCKPGTGLVLGNEVLKSGEPSDRLQARLDRTVTLYQNKCLQRIIVSGGIGKSGFDEAEKMKEYLMQKNIPKEIIFTDSEGVNTYASFLNLQNFRFMSRDTDLNIISQYFHLPRSKLIAHKLGYLNVQTSYARYFELRDIYSILRETAAYLIYSIFY